LALAYGTTLALREGFSFRTIDARRLLSTPFRAVWALDAEGEAR
jgi:hypothetical protein